MRVKALVMDHDGVLTDNLVTMDSNGVESCTYSKEDSYGIHLLRSAFPDFLFLVLTSEFSLVVDHRCKKLRVPFLKEWKKDVFLALWLNKNLLLPKEVVYVGNDTNDLSVFKNLDVIGVAVADAHPELLKEASYITKAKGGKGAVREVCDLMLSEYFDPFTKNVLGV